MVGLMLSFPYLGNMFFWKNEIELEEFVNRSQVLVREIMNKYGQLSDYSSIEGVVNQSVMVMLKTMRVSDQRCVGNFHAKIK